MYSPPANLDLVWQKLAGQFVPAELSAEGWCYDQLVGAAFALQHAKDIGYPDAPNVYRKALPDLQNPATCAYKQFAWGFYLNGAIHRVVWACERLLRFCAGEINKHDMSFPKIVQIVRNKTDKPEILCKVLDHFPKVENHRFEKDKDDNTVYNTEPVTETNVLQVLRGRVNRQKHWWWETRERQTGGDKASPAIWDQTERADQHELVIHALITLIDLYWAVCPRSKSDQT